MKADRSKIDDNNSRIVIVMVVTMVLCVSAIVASREFWSDISFRRGVLSQKTEVNDQLGENVENLDQLKSNFDQLEQVGPKPETISIALPLDENSPFLYSEFEAIAEDSELVVIAISIGDRETYSGGSARAKEPGKSVAESFDVTIRLNGPFDNLRQFLENVEENIRPMKIKSVAISGTDPELSMEVVVTTYLQDATELRTDTTTIR